MASLRILNSWSSEHQRVQRECERLVWLVAAGDSNGSETLTLRWLPPGTRLLYAELHCTLAHTGAGNQTLSVLVESGAGSFCGGSVNNVGTLNAVDFFARKAGVIAGSNDRGQRLTLDQAGSGVVTIGGQALIYVDVIRPAFPV